MNIENFKRCKKLLLVSCMALSFNAMADDLYNPQQTYSAGEYVSLNGNDYLAKWWVGAGQRPDAVVENAWDSPWQKITNNPERILNGPARVHGR